MKNKSWYYLIITILISLFFYVFFMVCDKYCSNMNHTEIYFMCVIPGMIFTWYLVQMAQGLIVFCDWIYQKNNKKEMYNKWSNR